MLCNARHHGAAGGRHMWSGVVQVGHHINGAKARVVDRVAQPSSHSSPCLSRSAPNVDQRWRAFQPRVHQRPVPIYPRCKRPDRIAQGRFAPARKLPLGARQPPVLPKTRTASGGGPRVVLVMKQPPHPRLCRHLASSSVASAGYGFGRKRALNGAGHGGQTQSSPCHRPQKKKKRCRCPLRHAAALCHHSLTRANVLS